MFKQEAFLGELRDILKKDPAEIDGFIELNIKSFFKTPQIAEYYRILKELELSDSSKTLSRLVMAWLAFLSGDNAGLTAILMCINEPKQEQCKESSLYYALKAITGFSCSLEERIKYAKLSMDVLPEGDCGFYMANAKLTYGQMLSGYDQYRAAAELFLDSYRLFFSEGMHFPAAVALANGLLNRYKLGEMLYVIDESTKALVMSASFVDGSLDYWNIMNLPLGMCYYEMNKPSLAIRHLKLAKSCIDSMKLFHMHGLIELYLFKSYFLLKDLSGMEEVREQAEKAFGNMHYRMTDMLVSMFRILSCRENQYIKLQPDIEIFEVEYMKDGDKDHMILMETLAYLKILGLNNLITINDMVKQLEKLRYVGLVPYLQMFLVLLAEMNFMENMVNEAAQCLREAVLIKKETGICAGFYLLPMKSKELLQSIDKGLYTELVQKYTPGPQTAKSQLLSAREREIMQLVAAGKSNEEIGRILFIGIGTIKWHINHIFSKLEVKNRIQAAQKARSLGEIS